MSGTGVILWQTIRALGVVHAEEGVEHRRSQGHMKK